MDVVYLYCHVMDDPRQPDLRVPAIYGAIFAKVNGNEEFAKVMGLPGRPVRTPGDQGAPRGPSAPLPPGA
jgi:hypothetical protein